MAATQNVFERKEVKYRLSADQYRIILAAMQGRLAPDAYGSTLVKSVYFDTERRDLIARSMEKPLYKEKLRVRSYGTPAEDEQVYVEIKKKYDGIVYKRRIGMSYAAARAYLGGMPYEEACAAYPMNIVHVEESVSDEEKRQIAHEIDAMLLRWGPLRASMLTMRVRTAYGPVDANGIGCSDESGLRVTFDSSVSYRDLMRSDAPHSARPLVDPGEVIMEIKARGAYPLWLADALNECRAFPSSFSKYGEAYRRCSSSHTPDFKEACCA